jgi:DNA-binding CsgD family transcriptional regulator
LLRSLASPVGNGADMVQKHRRSLRTRRISEASLRSRFCLTPAEAQIALGIADGKTLAAIAEARGVSVSTARGQLKFVFAKTGTHRQAELVALLLAPRTRLRRR